LEKFRQNSSNTLNLARIYRASNGLAKGWMCVLDLGAQAEEMTILLKQLLMSGKKVNEWKGVY
jgi:hypothetical protein